MAFGTLAIRKEGAALFYGNCGPTHESSGAGTGPRSVLPAAMERGFQTRDGEMA
jgi:hypothetical protein